MSLYCLSNIGGQNKRIVDAKQGKRTETNQSREVVVERLKQDLEPPLHSNKKFSKMRSIASKFGSKDYSEPKTENGEIKDGIANG